MAIDQNAIDLRNLTQEPLFFQGEVEQDEEHQYSDANGAHGIGKPVYDEVGKEALVVKVTRETLQESINRNTIRNMTFTQENEKTCATEEATLFRSTTGVAVGIMRNGSRYLNYVYYHQDAVVVANSIFYISRMDENAYHDPTESGSGYWRRGLYNDENYHQQMQLFNVSVNGSDITLNSVFENYKVQDSQIQNGTIISFISPSTPSGYARGEGHNLFIDGNKYKLFETLDQSFVDNSAILPNKLTRCYYVSALQAFFLEKEDQQTFTRRDVGDIFFALNRKYDDEAKGDIKLLCLKEAPDDEELGSYVFLSMYNKFSEYLQNLFITNPEVFNTSLDERRAEISASALKQTKKFCFSQQFVYSWQNNYTLYCFKKTFNTYYYNIDKTLYCYRYNDGGEDKTVYTYDIVIDGDELVYDANQNQLFYNDNPQYPLHIALVNDVVVIGYNDNDNWITIGNVIYSQSGNLEIKDTIRVVYIPNNDEYGDIVNENLQIIGKAYFNNEAKSEVWDAEQGNKNIYTKMTVVDTNDFYVYTFTNPNNFAVGDGAFTQIVVTSKDLAFFIAGYGNGDGHIKVGYDDFERYADGDIIYDGSYFTTKTTFNATEIANGVDVFDKNMRYIGKKMPVKINGSAEYNALLDITGQSSDLDTYKYKNVKNWEIEGGEGEDYFIPLFASRNSSGDTMASIVYLPIIVNIVGVNDIFDNDYDLQEQSLPNITGDITINTMNNGTSSSGLFNQTFNNQSTYFVIDIYGSIEESSHARWVGVNFNANRVSSIYQDNANVKQEAVKVYWYMQLT